MNGLFAFSGHMQGSHCLDLSVVEQIPAAQLLHLSSSAKSGQTLFTTQLLVSVISDSKIGLDQQSQLASHPTDVKTCMLCVLSRLFLYPVTLLFALK